MSRGAVRLIPSQSGHTLLELVVVLAVVALACAIGHEGLAGLGRGASLESSAVGLTQLLRLAQWQAVGSGRRVRVATLATPDGSWRFRLEREESSAWVPAGEEQRVPGGAVVAVAGPAEKVFNPDGTCSMGSITLRGAGGAVYRCTLAPATGRVRLYRGDREAGHGF